MVPGLTERERLAADLRRAEWLAEAVRGSARVGRSTIRPARIPTWQADWKSSLWLTGVALVRHVGGKAANPLFRPNKSIRKSRIIRTRHSV